MRQGLWTENLRTCEVSRGQNPEMVQAQSRVKNEEGGSTYVWDFPCSVIYPGFDPGSGESQGIPAAPVAVP